MSLKTALAASIIAFAVAAPAIAQPTTAPTLYKRLGGYDALAAVTDDFLARLATDPGFARFFAGHSTDSIKRIRQNIVNQLCVATGGPCVYTGRDMKTSHGGMGITETEWTRRSSISSPRSTSSTCPRRRRTKCSTTVSTLKKDIVEKP